MSSPPSLSDREALELADAGVDALSDLMAAAAARRDAAFGRRITFSPKVFLPITNLCRNRCDYCSFRRSPGQLGEWTMSPPEIEDWLERGREAGCVEALFCLGDSPERAFANYRRFLASTGHNSTADYLWWAGRRALARGLIPHTNAGILSAHEMARLKQVNASLGLMLESVSPRLCGPGMPHRRAPDKRPARRLQMTREAGELAIPFTSGLLVGIGETRRERVETLLAIRDVHRAHGHIQEVIVQPFRPHPATSMGGAAGPDSAEIAQAVALARLILPDEVSVQAPPNLVPASLSLLLLAGINDLGGVSPLTPDYINSHHPWPHLADLAATCERLDFELRPRLPIYPAFIERPGFLHDDLRAPVREASDRMARGRPLWTAPPPLAGGGEAHHAPTGTATGATS
ncbi:MAG TPA: 7,8-didemethyl-8-hydroxy-5-deazariboflavin synthase CofG [Gemmatimonadales bacterium]|jgi:FO synthase